jgi:hypothetical protein
MPRVTSTPYAFFKAYTDAANAVGFFSKENMHVFLLSVVITSHPCDPLGSSGDAFFCSFCDSVRRVCSAKSAEESKIFANRACSFHQEDLFHNAYHSVSTQWLIDVACDASKIAYGAGSIGFVTLTTGNTTLTSEDQWMSLLSVCAMKETKKAFVAISCPKGKISL